MPIKKTPVEQPPPARPAKAKPKQSTTPPSKKPPAQRKRLSSAPMREKSLIALAAKVRQRKEPKTQTPQKSVDEDQFPRAAPSKKGKKKKSKAKEDIFVPKIDSAFLLPDNEGDVVGAANSMEVVVRPTGTTLEGSGLPIVKGNKDNDGMLIVGGQPFWFTQLPPDETDDELVMNAAVLIDVLENRLKLVPMPDIEIVLDPMEETTVLAARDKSCYTRDVLFGNTVRSMVNLN
ncbi:hypothetical protein GCK32_005831, partial [Trichostrongylus colubriformis]